MEKYFYFFFKNSTLLLTWTTNLKDMKRIAFALLLLVLTGGWALGQGSQDEMMEKWAAAMTPTENHEFLANMAGDWIVTMKTWMDPSAEPEISKGKSSTKMIMGGRYMEEMYSGMAGDMPMEGRNLIGYDNLKEEYSMVWIDNMGTGMMVGSGQRDGNTLEFQLTYPNLDGGIDDIRITIEVMNGKGQVMKMYMPSPDGGEYLWMENTYSKK